MKKIVTLACAAVCAVVAASCSESSGPSGSSVLLDASSAFTTVPAGFSDLNSSFAASATDGAFQPLFDGRGPGGSGGRWSVRPRPGFGIGFMGGLGGPFLGLGLLDFFHDGSCAFSSSTNLVTCGKQTRGGLTITHTFQYTDASGNPQSKIDNTTNTIVEHGVRCRNGHAPRQRTTRRQRIEQSEGQRSRTGKHAAHDRRRVRRVGEYDRDVVDGRVHRAALGWRHDHRCADSRWLSGDESSAVSDRGHDRSLDDCDGDASRPVAGDLVAPRSRHVRRVGHGEGRHHRRRQHPELHPAAAVGRLSCQ